MKELLEYILEGIAGKDNFKIVEDSDDEAYRYNITVNSEKIGLVIGRQGNTIKSIQTLLRVRGKLEGKKVFVNVESE
jgi:predicted RNA-binding protein YlqC (UPF0109 family)